MAGRTARLHRYAYRSVPATSVSQISGGLGDVDLGGGGAEAALLE